ncbi:MAG: helix-hairpin-helix domain-containing protein, partial [Bacteroidia bacterium]|nr:helix-hairpin-helix domain-containing protein [Bacteroidia bacterium]
MSSAVKLGLSGCLLAFCSITQSVAQEIPPAATNQVEQLIEDRIEVLAQNAEEETDFTEIAEALRIFAENPINLNKTSREELSQLGLLSDVQIDQLLNHIRVYGPLIALEELQAVDGYDLNTIYSILPFVTLKTEWTSEKDWFRKAVTNGKHTFILRSQRVLETQKGYLPVPEGSTSRSYYLGDPWKHYARYRFVYQRKISFGVTAEKDQGEELFRNTQSSFDFYSAHLTVRDIGKIRSVNIGDYQLAYGQGLTLWTGLAFGKSPEAVSIKKNPYGILPYTSVNEFLFKRGMAVSLRQGPWSLDVFYSSRGLDGTLSDSLNQEETFSSFFESGYHRSLSELDKKNSIHETFYGGHLQYSRKRFGIGITGVHSEYNKPLLPSPSLYNRFYFNGKQLTNVGTDYSYLWRNISLFGEVSRSSNSSVAYLNGAIFALDPKVSFSVLNRNYPRDFQSVTSNPFRESSNTINENGTYFGLMIRPVRQITFTGYYDAFSFPWLRYQADSPTEGFEYVIQTTYTPYRGLYMYVRYRVQSKPENAGSHSTPVDIPVDILQRNYRYDITSKISPAVTLHSRVEMIS